MNDHDDIRQTEKQLVKLLKEQKEKAQSVANALTVIEHDSDRRKRALAIAMVPFLKAGKSGTVAEAFARATDEYGAELDQLGIQLEAAHVTRQDGFNIQNRIDVGRSFLSRQRETIRNFKE